MRDEGYREEGKEKRVGEIKERRVGGTRKRKGGRKGVKLRRRGA